MNKHSELYVVDISSFIFRAFYAIRILNAPNGTPVNAVYGVISMLLKLFKEKKPTHVIIAQDSKEKSFRHLEYNQYKANRSEPPDELKPQFAIIDEFLDLAQIPRLKKPGFEADDIIGTIAQTMTEYFEKIIIISADKDLFQLVNDQVIIWDTMKDRLYNGQAVQEKMGVPPEQIIDYLSIVGDTSDNIPGVRGIGEKGAVKLLQNFANLDEIYSHLDKIENAKTKQALVDYKENAFLSRNLVRLNTKMDLNLTDVQCQYDFKPNDLMAAFFTRLGFKTFLQKFSDAALLQNSAPLVPPVNLIKEKTSEAKLQEGDVLALKKNISTYNIKALSIYIDHAQSIALYHPDLGIHVYPAEEKSAVLKSLIFSDIKIYTIQSKEILHTSFFLELEIKAKFFEVTLASFILNPELKHQYEVILMREMQIEIASQTMTQQHAFYIYQLAHFLKEKLEHQQLLSCFEKYEMPMAVVLAEMEYKGVMIDRKFLKSLEIEFDHELHLIETKIKTYADQEINLKSPKQVSFLLFEKLQMPIIKKTKTGVSTDSSVLEKLAALNINEVPALLLDFREIDKLLSTYIKSLPQLISTKTQRIHTTFHQEIAATGRLTSENPNLQNIPIKTSRGKLLRKAFIAPAGYELISADYSQIELRILAHYSQDPVMMEAFIHNKDIHAQTASEIFSVPLEKVSAELRNRAKAINFGLIYGQSSFGLSETLNINQSEAKEYITHYFHKFSKVKNYLDSLKQFCEKNGFAQSYLGRKRYLPDIRSSNRMIKSSAERMAINTPIQGTAADIIKIAMVHLQKKLKKEYSSASLILQVHDELLIEVPKALALPVAQIVKDTMEHAVSLSIPLKVDIAIGKNWLEMQENAIF